MGESRTGLTSSRYQPRLLTKSIAIECRNEGDKSSYISKLDLLFLVALTSPTVVVFDLLRELCGGEYAAGSGTALGSGESILNPPEFQHPAKRLEGD